jgi:hypothetical protein
MDALDALGLARYLRPRPVAALLLAALFFFPKPSYGLIEAAAQRRAQEITSLLIDAVFPGSRGEWQGIEATRRAPIEPAGASSLDTERRG